MCSRNTRRNTRAAAMPVDSLIPATPEPESCCHLAVCVCPDDRKDDDVSWLDDDGDGDFLFEIARDRRMFDD